MSLSSGLKPFVEKSIDRLKWVPFVTLFLLLLSRNLSLTAILIIICLIVGLFGFIFGGGVASVLPLPGYLFPSLDLGDFQP